jgi:hypothetical protein
MLAKLPPQPQLLPLPLLLLLHLPPQLLLPLLLPELLKKKYLINNNIKYFIK